ncbi:MAG TPA: 2-C-methyl-D-erythritol 4-phosphate cytidylyltransferase [Candidatus Dormibacteraeota bacterium]|nr:2-C-methyl-D-erythritol 4-phosphate cytidylyltransferase [Candidatus Dormibacteraeota bacterium]
MEIGAIVAAAGLGTRLGRGAKALVELNGRTALSRVVELFLALDEVGRIVVVGPPARLEIAEREVQALRPGKPVVVRPGGDTRQQSVRAGLQALEGCEYVLVHDAARPMASPALVRRVIAAAIATGAAIPGVPPRDAVKRVEGGRLVESLDRAKLLLAQTPQGFRYSLLERAHFQAADAGLMGDDDAQLVAAAGYAVAVVPGEPTNVKLTTPEDMEVLEALLREHEPPRAPAPAT